ncbi:MAG: ABC transporter substrate-binding protein [Firmicutes bacterium]|nr:ABC transporter substrate-binding protein [Dethiobacter sp.]MBS3888080.1 ABC transporter substrate-binding protein [Bacillota bacterium]MBS4053927.1 ABC transporter substrate-binding protein [Thermaerobacter sp.]
MTKKIVVLLLVAAHFALIIGCAARPKLTTGPSEFSAALQKSRGTTVTFYGWGGSSAVNNWFDNVVAPSLLAEYGITLRRVPMNIDEILRKLSTEKQANKVSGDIDVMWINGENFYAAKTEGLLYGPFNTRIDNFNRLIDPNAPDTNYDFGVPTEGMSVPLGRAQLVFMADRARLDTFPTSAAALLELARSNPGRFTYPAPPDFTGSAFVRNIIYDIVGFEALNNAPAEKAAIQAVIQPALDFLNELEPYLWERGTTYPADVAALDRMFAEGQLLWSMSYTPLKVGQLIAENRVPPSVETFVFDKGNVGNTHYVAIPFNSPNKDAAFVLIHHLISVAMQAAKLDVNNWGDLPVVDLARLTASERELIENANIGQGVLPMSELLSKRLPEVHAQKVAIIEELWREQVLQR